MLLPVGCVDTADFHGISAMNHFSVPQIDANMGGSTGIVGPLEKDQVTWLHLGRRYDTAPLPPAFRSKPSKVKTSAAVVDHIGYEPRTVESAGAVTTPYIGRAQILFCFGNQLSSLAGGLDLYGIYDAPGIQIEVRIEVVDAVAERKRHSLGASNPRNWLSGRDFSPNGNSKIGAATDFYAVSFFISQGDRSIGNSNHLTIQDR